MRIAIIVGAFVLSAFALSGTAYAWNIDEDHGTWASIRCEDGSSAIVSKGGDGTWTVTAAGTNGQAGGSFSIIGQAALFACGE